MKFRYSVARYVPSMVRGEALNLGVLIEDDDGNVAAQFLGRLSQIRAIYPDADLATLALVRDYFTKTLAPSPLQLHLFESADGASLDKLVRENQGTITLSAPSVTIGTDMTEELDDLFATFVAPKTSIAPRPISSVRTAPSRLRQRVDKWLTDHHLVGPHLYQRNVWAPGTIVPWAFDFALQNGHLTLVQTLSLTGGLDIGMSRAALVAARVDDVRAAASVAPESQPVEAFAVHDAKDESTPPLAYLEGHGVRPVPVRSKEQMRRYLEQPAKSQECSAPAVAT